MKKKEIPLAKAVLIVRLVYGNLSDEGYIELEEWIEEDNHEIFMKKLKEVIKEKYKIHFSKKK